MKNLFKILILVLLISFSFSEQQIRTTKTSYYSVKQKFGKDIEIIERSNVRKYDSQNNLIEVLNYDSLGALFDVYIAEHDSKNNIITGSWYDSDGDLNERRKYKYDRKIFISM